MAGSLSIIGQHLWLSLRLFRRHGGLFMAMAAAGALASHLLLRLAVEIGMFSRVLGLLALTPVILLDLLVAVGMFMILRDGLPSLRRRRVSMPAAADPTADPAGDIPASGLFATALLAVLIPFYSYYAGWGLLGDTLRGYSQVFHDVQMVRVDFTSAERVPTALEVGRTGWVVLAVGLIWLIRRFAKSMQRQGKAAFWPMLVVLCEASWALLGLFVIAGWKDQLGGWLATLPTPAELLDLIVPAARAAITEAGIRPVDWPPVATPLEVLVQLFWYALLPLVWFNLGAIVYGHDLDQIRHPTRRVAGEALARWQALPRPVTDFIGHFWAGVVKRWHAVTNGVLLAASAGLALTVSVLVLWRFVDWLGNWAWIGLAELIGPQDILYWKVLAQPLNQLFYAPGALTGGILTMPLQICILAAGLELAGRAQQAEVVTEAAEARD